MAYYAELDGVSGLAQCASPLALPPNFELNYDLFILANGSEDYFSSPFSGRGLGFLSSFVAFYSSDQQVYFNYPSGGRPAINDRVNIRFTSTDNGDGTFTIRCYISVNGGAEEQLNRAIGSDVFSQPLTPWAMEWGRRPNTLYRKVGIVGTKYYENGVLTNDWDFNQSSGNTAPDLVGSNPATLSGGFSWVFFEDGGGAVEQPELHEFSGSAVVNVSIAASAYKTVSLAGNAQASALSQSSLSKLAEFSGQSKVNVATVSLFEKVATFTGTATVDVTSQSDFSKRVAFSGESTVNVTASGVLFDENFELHTFAGGATISATASGQAIKVGLVSGESRVNATSAGQAQKVVSLSGNVQVAVSAQSAFSKLASLAGNAVTRITTAATITKHVLLNGASTVLARASGTFFNTDSNVETYETTIQGRVKAPLVVKGTVKSLTIEGRVK